MVCANHLNYSGSTPGIVHWSSRGANGWHMSISRIIKGFPKAWKHYFIFLKWYLFRTLNNITSNCKKVPFSRFWEHHFQLQKKVPFSRFWEHRFQLQKRYLFVLLIRSLEDDKKVTFSRFKSLFGKVRNGWKVDNIDVKIFSLESLKYPPFFSKKVPFFNFSPNRLALTKKVTILHFVLWKMNAES